MFGIASRSCLSVITSDQTRTSNIAHIRPALTPSLAHLHLRSLLWRRSCLSSRVEPLLPTSSALAAILTAIIDLLCVRPQSFGSRNAKMTVRRRTGSRQTRRSVVNARAQLRRMVVASMFSLVQFNTVCVDLFHLNSHMTCKKCKYEFCWVCMGKFDSRSMFRC